MVYAARFFYGERQKKRMKRETARTLEVVLAFRAEMARNQTRLEADVSSLMKALSFQTDQLKLGVDSLSQRVEAHVTAVEPRFDEIHSIASRQSRHVLEEIEAKFGEMKERVDCLARDVANCGARLDEGVQGAADHSQKLFERSELKLECVRGELARLGALDAKNSTSAPLLQDLRALVEMIDIELSRMLGKGDAIYIFQKFDFKIRTLREELDNIRRVDLKVPLAEIKEVQRRRTDQDSLLKDYESSTLREIWRPLLSDPQASVRLNAIRRKIMQ